VSQLLSTARRIFAANCDHHLRGCTYLFWKFENTHGVWWLAGSWSFLGVVSEFITYWVRRNRGFNCGIALFDHDVLRAR
jgi:hypothetical protein